MKQQYINTLKKLYKVNLFRENKKDLSNIHKASQLLGNPHLSIPTIHITGSNSKGSVAHKLSKIFQHNHYKTALFTSPHLFTFRERIQINSQYIPVEDLVPILNLLFDIKETHDIPLTYFEIVYLASLIYYRDQKVDILIAEGGIGAKLDAVSLSPNLLSIITTISLDHTDTLGDSHFSVLYNKAYVIKSKNPVVIGPKVLPLSPLLDRALKFQSPIYLAPENSPESIVQTALLPLSSNFYLPNTQEGLASNPLCRIEKIGNFTLSVAHNPESLSYLFSKVGKVDFILLACGLHKDDFLNYESVKEYGKVYRIGGASSRLVKAKYRNFGDIVGEGGLQETMEEVRKQGGTGVVCGSFYVMREARELLGIQDEKDPEELLTF